MKALYKCKEVELYGGVDVVLALVKSDLSVFGMKKGYYTLAYLDSVRVQKEAAREMLNEQQRDSAVTGKRLWLLERRDEALGLMRDLGSYIRSAWPDEEMQQAKRQEAGFNRVVEAERENWEQLPEMMQMADSFVERHEAALLAGNNMPAGFGGLVHAGFEAVDAAVREFLKLKNMSTTSTAEKVKANNALFKVVMGMCLDGQAYFMKNKDRKRLYTWKHVLTLVSPPRMAGLKGDVKIGGTFEPGAGAEIRMLQKGGEPVVFSADANGKFYSGGLAHGAYEVEVRLAGMVVIREEIVLRAGVKSYRHWVMVGE